MKRVFLALGPIVSTSVVVVILLGNSLGTFASQSYLASPERAANVSHHVNIDGHLLGSVTATDRFIRETPPGSVSIEVVPRGDTVAVRTVNVHSTPSTEGRISVRLNAFG